MVLAGITNSSQAQLIGYIRIVCDPDKPNLSRYTQRLSIPSSLCLVRVLAHNDHRPHTEAESCRSTADAITWDGDTGATRQRSRSFDIPKSHLRAAHLLECSSERQASGFTRFSQRIEPHCSDTEIYGCVFKLPYTCSDPSLPRLTAAVCSALDTCHCGYTEGKFYHPTLD